MLRESGLKTFCWALLQTVEKDDEKEPLALRVWPVQDNQYQCYIGEDAYSANQLDSKNELFVKLIPYNSWNHIGAKSITLEIDLESVHIDRFIRTFRKNFRSRLVTTGNTFAMRFYSEVLKIKVVDVNPMEKRSDNELMDAFVADFQNINLENQFYEITSDTVIKCVVATESLDVVPRITLADIGGLAATIKEICSTIEFILSAQFRGMAITFVHV